MVTTHANEAEQGTLCIVTTRVVAGARIYGVLHQEPATPEDSGYFCWAKDDNLNPAEDPPPSPDRLLAACLHCVLEIDGEVGVLLERARQTGIATTDD